MWHLLEMKVDELDQFSWVLQSGKHTPLQQGEGFNISPFARIAPPMVPVLPVGFRTGADCKSARTPTSFTHKFVWNKLHQLHAEEEDAVFGSHVRELVMRVPVHVM